MKITRTRIAALTASLALIAGVGAATIASAATGGPSVNLTSNCSTAASSSPIAVTAAFSQDVNSFNSGNVTVTNGTVSNVASSTTASSTFTFDVTPTAEGPVTIMVPADAVTSTASSTGNLQSNTITCNYDVTQPTISNVAVTNITSSGATIGFDTSEATNATISYGTSTSYGATVTSSGTAGQSVNLSGLQASTTYDYQIMATDAAGNATTTQNGTFTTSAAASTSAPVISNIQVMSNGTSSETITWNTDVAATGNISYGTSTSYGASTTVESTASTTHSVTLSNLSEATLYHFQISETNAGGTSTSADQTFFTSSTSATTPLSVTGVDAVSSSGIADNVFADGWKWVMHITVPDNENAFRIRFSDWGNASSSFPANGNIRISSAQSSNASTTANGVVSTGNGYSDWIYLNGDNATSTAGRQIDLTVEVKIPFGTNPGQYSSTFTAQTYPSTATSTATQ